MNKEYALEILKISEEDFFNKNIVKVFDGIAGSAKSTAAAFLLKDRIEKYGNNRRICGAYCLPKE